MSFMFKSKKERAKEARRDQRQAFRQAENAIDDVKERIKQMDKDAKKQWDQAREAMKAGQKSVAQRLLISYRASQVLITKLEQKRWVFEQFFTKLQAANSDQQFADALSGINKVIKIDPERVADVFDEAQDLLGEQLDSDRFWEKMYTKETEGATASLEDHIPSLDELGKQLEQEAAVEIGGGATERVNTELDSRIKAGQERVKKLLDGK
ncbi:MAG: Snf7 family protein [bacterium]